jgi:hypothetical protein
MARVGDASASSVVTADVVTQAAPIEGYLQYGKLAPGDLLDNDHPVATIHDPLVDRLPAAQTRARVSALDGEALAAPTESRAGGAARKVREAGQGLPVTPCRTVEHRAVAAAGDAYWSGSKAQRSGGAPQRFATLADEGVASAQALEEARRDQAVAEQDCLGTKNDISATKTAAQSMAQGITVGELTTVERSYSAQRVDEVELRLAQVKSEIESKQGRTRSGRPSRRRPDATVRNPGATGAVRRRCHRRN